MERRSRLGADRLEQLLVMKPAWQGTMVDWAAMNSRAVDEIEINDYSDLLQADKDVREWDEIEFDSDRD